MSEKKKRILIVDDTPENIKVLVPTLMEQQSFDINIANSGKEALDFLQKVKPDLILLDIIMPDMDGFKTIKEIKSREECKDIPVIFLSARNETEDLAKGFELGAADFLSKPFNSVELLARVKTHIELKMSRDIIRDNLQQLVRERTEQLENETYEKLKLKDQLSHSQKMEAIGQLAGGVAHDFNNQLGGIIGSAELIKHNTDNEKIMKYADMILNAAQSSANLTKQLLAFARKGKDTSMPVEVNKLINQICTLLHRSIDKKIDFVRKLSRESTYTIGDPAQLENALLNIAINASHAMPEGGTITLETSLVTLTSHELELYKMKDKRCIKITITDNGSGMTKSIRERIFEPFFTTKEKDKGTGLGLSATYGTVQQHNGHIEVESEPGVGTAFTLWLPASDEKSFQKEKVTVIADFSNIKVLLIDDEDIILFTVSEILKQKGCEVVTAKNGPEGIAAFKEGPDDYDAVILDSIMPRMNGMEVFKRLKEIKDDVKVILASGYSGGGTQTFLDLGIADYLRKPYHMSTLTTTLLSVIND